MPFSALPTEIVLHIILHCVKVREHKVERALRLRFVSKFWDSAVLEAISVSGVLDKHAQYRRLRPRLIARKVIRGAPGTLSRPLRIIQQVAERILAHRNKRRDVDGDSYYAALSDCITDLCPSYNAGPPQWATRHDWFVYAEPSASRVDEDDQEFRQALLAAAAWTNEIELVRELLPFFRDCGCMLWPSGSDQKVTQRAFGAPILLAAFQGNNEILNLLLGPVLTDTDSDRLPLGHALYTAIVGDQLSTVELVLELLKKWPRVDEYSLDLTEYIRETASVDIFKRLVPFADRQSSWIPRHADYHRSRQLADIAHRAAAHGNMALLKYIVEDGGHGVPIEWYRLHSREPVAGAAEGGRPDVLAYLLVDRGLPLRPAVLRLAARSRDPEVMRTVIDCAAERRLKDLDYGPALIAATETENERVVTLLLSRSGGGGGGEQQQQHVTIDDEHKARARRCATVLGLESMTELLARLLATRVPR